MTTNEKRETLNKVKTMKEEEEPPKNSGNTWVCRSFQNISTNLTDFARRRWKNASADWFEKCPPPPRVVILESNNPVCKQAIQLFCSAASFSLRGGRVPSKVLFTAKHLTVFGFFRIALSKRRGEKNINYVR